MSNFAKRTFISGADPGFCKGGDLEPRFSHVSPMRMCTRVFNTRALSFSDTTTLERRGSRIYSNLLQRRRISRFTSDELWRVCTPYAAHAMVRTTVVSARATRRCMLVNEEDRRGGPWTPRTPPWIRPCIYLQSRRCKIY